MSYTLIHTLRFEERRESSIYSVATTSNNVVLHSCFHVQYQQKNVTGNEPNFKLLIGESDEREKKREQMRERRREMIEADERKGMKK